MRVWMWIYVHIWTNIYIYIQQIYTQLDDRHTSLSFFFPQWKVKNIHDICGGRIDVTMTIIEAQVRLHCQFRFFQASWTYLQTDPSNDWVAYELLKWPGGKKIKTWVKLPEEIMFTWFTKPRSSTVHYTRPYSNDCGFRMRPLKNKRTNSSFKVCFVFRSGGHTKRISYPYMIQYFILFMNPTLQTFFSSLILRSSSQLIRSQSSRPTPWPVPGFLVKPVKLEMADRLEPRVLGKMAPGTDEKP